MTEKKSQSPDVRPGDCCLVFVRDVKPDGGVVVDCHVWGENREGMARVAVLSLVRMPSSSDDDEDEDFSPLSGGEDL